MRMKVASEIEPRRGTGYPSAYADGFEGRLKRALTPFLGLTQLGMNLTTLEPGARSSHRHWHREEDEAVYILDGEVTLVTDEGETLLSAGCVAGFPAGEANGHCLVNTSDGPATFIEIGSRSPTEVATYPDIDMMAEKAGGVFVFRRKDGTAY